MKTTLLTLAAFAVPGTDAFSFDLSSIIKQLPASAFNHSLPANRTIISTVDYKCAKAGQHASGFTATITPDSPKANDEVTTIFDYDLDEDVTSGTATYSATYNFIPISPTVDDLCVDQAKGAYPDPCPLAKGHHNSKSISVFPSGLSGTLASKFLWKDQNGEQILCMTWTVKM